MTINVCRNRLRSPWRRHRELDETLSETAADSQWDSILQEESGVMAAVLALPEKYREVIHLFYYEDYSIAQISRILHKKESTIRSLLFRARNILSETLKEGLELD